LAEKPAYALSIPRINIGRCADVRDSRNRLIRTNHVAFTDADRTTNDTVSRRHAHIDYTDGSADYRIFDDRSAHGTSVLRDGMTIEVPSGSRGIRLQSGDEIVLGEARIRVKISKGP
jgi:predicted component of type VI protein secretion system